MTLLAGILAILTGAAWFAGITHLIVGVRRSFHPTNLTFALMALLAGAHALTFVPLQHAHDVEQYVAAMRAAVTLGALTLAVLPWFAHFYTGAARLWKPAALSATYVLIAIVNQLRPYGLFFDTEPSLVHFQLPWGEITTSHNGIRTGSNVVLFWFIHAFNYSYVYAACRAQYRRGQRRHAIALAASTTILLIGMIGNLVIGFALLRFPFVAQFGFIALVLTMMFWLNTDERFRTLFAQASEGIFIADGSGRYMDVNAAGAALLGYTRDELRQMNIFDVVAPEDIPIVTKETTTLIGGGTVRSELQLRRKDGSTFTGELYGQLLSDGHLIGLVRDVTEHKQLMRSLEDRVAARTAEYAELNRQLESFSYSVSHDLRAPVRAIAGFSGLLAQEHAHGLDDVGRRHLSRIEAAAAHMNELIEGLLQLAQISHRALQDEEVDLSGVARDELRLLREREPAREVQAVCPPSLTARGDGRLLRIVLHNLLENAWKYTSNTSGATIEFGCDASGAEPTYFVRDNGAGFDMRYAHRLFEPFQRLHSATEFTGTGIGLATVARVLQRHGGRIWAEAAPDKGATFYFTLSGRKHAPLREGVAARS